MIWLAVYNDFFKKKVVKILPISYYIDFISFCQISSSDLSLALDDKSISELFESQYCIDLIKCFLTQNKIGCDTHIYDLLLAQKGVCHIARTQPRCDILHYRIIRLGPERLHG